MFDILKDVKQTALETGEKAIRLFFEIVAVASERMRSRTDDVGYPSYSPSAEPTPPPAAVPVEPLVPASADPPESTAAAESKPNARRRVSARRRGKKRPDQMLRVLTLLTDGSGWMSAKELSDAGGAAGIPILPGNVRKVIRARGVDVIETRPREGSRRGALEYRITEAGRQRLSDPS